MKRGLKLERDIVDGLQHIVRTQAPMKRGLKQQVLRIVAVVPS